LFEIYNQKKIEELTLYVIEINKENKALAKKNHQLEQRIQHLEQHEN
jgi:cell division protein FtsB